MTEETNGLGKEDLGSVKDLVYLLSCAVRGEKTDPERVAGMDLTGLYRLAEKHMLTSATALALEKAGVQNDVFKQAYGMAVRKNTLLDLEREALFAELDKKGIWYMPLKGSVLKDYYPSYGMRQMADNDILFDAAYREEVKRFFVQRGYEVESFGKGNHDVYQKPPVSNFEMHVSLVNDIFSPQIFRYYENVKDRLLPDGKGGAGLRFREEDFYLFSVVHEFKHFSGGGTGLRSLLDTYVLWKKFGESFDREYIRKELEQLGIGDFEEINRRLALDLFDGREPDEEEREMLLYICSSGTYGTLSNRIDNVLKGYGTGTRAAKAKYLFKRFFVPMEKVKNYYPFFYRHKILLPLLPVYRVGRALTVSRKKILRELKTLRKKR